VRSQIQEFPDDELDREIDALLAIDPSPQFLPRIRAAVETPRPLNWRIPGVALFGGLLATALFVGLVIREERPQRLEAAASMPREPLAASQATPASPPSAGPEKLRVTSGARLRAGTLGESVAALRPEVLVPRAEQDALQRVLLRSAQEPLVISSAALVTQQTGGTPAPLLVPAIAIERLTSEPIDAGDSR